MSASKLFLLSLVAVCVPIGLGGDAGPVLQQQQPGSSLQQTLPPASTLSIGETIAHAQRLGERHLARAGFWQTLAEGLGEPGASVANLVLEAQAERRAALAEADERLLLRLQAAGSLPPGPYAPVLDPARFSDRVDHPYFPLRPGSVRTYRGRTIEGEMVRIDETVPVETVVVAGISCRAVSITEYQDGVRTEEITEWYARHDDGTVWFLGHVEKKYDDGFLDALDGWRTGRDGARPGVIMPGSLLMDRAHRKEYKPDDAEDIITVVGLDETVTVNGVTYTNCVKIEEWSPLENEREAKYFAPGVGLVLEVDLVTGERIEIVRSSG